MNNNDLAMWVFSIALTFFMAVWAVVGFFIIRWGLRLTRFSKKAMRIVNTASAYPRMSAGLIQPRNLRPAPTSEIQRIVRQEMDRYR